MSDPRDDLAAIIHSATCPYEDCHESATTDDYNGADVILARWRLVPVEEQHRAADELTQHDQDAGHYGQRPREWHAYDCGALYGDKPHWHYT